MISVSNRKKAIPLLSHDAYEMKYKFTSMGIHIACFLMGRVCE